MKSLSPALNFIYSKRWQFSPKIDRSWSCPAPLEGDAPVTQSRETEISEILDVCRDLESWRGNGFA